MRALAIFKTLLVLAVAAFGGLLLYGWARDNPQDMPWTPLDLGEPPGVFTGTKLAGLANEADACRALLDRAGIAYRRLDDRAAGQCGYRDGVRPADGDDPQTIAYRPEGVTISCPIEAGLALWEWHIVQPAAQSHFGQRVVRIDHLGGYSCRRINGAAEGRWSEHATADALDIAAFTLEDGTRISVLGDWASGEEPGAFLHEVRDGACSLFSTVLSPDYNAAHADHLHLDQAERGSLGGRACR